MSIQVTITADNGAQLQALLAGMLQGGPKTLPAHGFVPPDAPEPEAEAPKEVAKKTRGKAKPPEAEQPSLGSREEPETEEATEEFVPTRQHLSDLIRDTLMSCKSISADTAKPEASLREVLRQYGAAKQSEIKDADVPAVYAKVLILAPELVASLKAEDLSA